jgi:precorrin-3B synthase
MDGVRERRGFCPSVWTPMASGDGLLVRVRASVRALTSKQIRALARLAREHGNGQIELTRRANLQLRGLREPSLPALRRELASLGLIENSPEREKQLNWLLAHPLTELAEGGAELGPVVRAIETLLASGQLPNELPSKLSIVLDGLGRGPRALIELEADLRIDVRSEQPELAYLSVAVEQTQPRSLGACARADLPWALSQLACTLARLSPDGERMRKLITRHGMAPLVSALAGRLVSAPPLPPLVVETDSWVGFEAGERPWLGLALPFGAGTADCWEALADLAERFGTGELRATPLRTLILPGIASSQRDEVEALASAVGWILDESDPLLRVSACAGAPACASAVRETRAFASSLARLVRPRLEQGATLHVSGCDKGCARSGPADITLVHTASGCQLGFGLDAQKTSTLPTISLETARHRLTASTRDVRVPPPMTRHYEYERDGAEIYRRSFAIIRSEAKLARFTAAEERVAVRLIHTSGMVDLADELVFSPGFAEVASRAIRAGAPILCDANMIVSGVTRARLSAHNELLCFLDHPALPALAAEQGTTRSAAALTLWGDRLDGAVVAIGNAPTALFRLLELFDETSARPAAIIGLPVGFVGAAESKQALCEDGRVPFMIVRGRRGGSAMTVAAINALASDKE